MIKFSVFYQILSSLRYQKLFEIRVKTDPQFYWFLHPASFIIWHCSLTGGANWYSAAACSWVWPAFLPRCEFSDPKKSFLIQDCCTVQADVYVVGVVKCLT